MPVDLQSTPDGVILPVKAQPGAKKNDVAGIRNGRLLVKCTQAPEKGKANDAIVEIIARYLKIKKSQISLISGSTNSEKKFLLSGVQAADLKIDLE